MFVGMLLFSVANIHSKKVDYPEAELHLQLLENVYHWGTVQSRKKSTFLSQSPIGLAPLWKMKDSSERPNPLCF